MLAKMSSLRRAHFSPRSGVSLARLSLARAAAAAASLAAAVAGIAAALSVSD
jgi:hypothetical protein